MKFWSQHSKHITGQWEKNRRTHRRNIDSTQSISQCLNNKTKTQHIERRTQKKMSHDCLSMNTIDAPNSQSFGCWLCCFVCVYGVAFAWPLRFVWYSVRIISSGWCPVLLVYPHASPIKQQHFLGAYAGPCAYSHRWKNCHQLFDRLKTLFSHVLLLHGVAHCVHCVSKLFGRDFDAQFDQPWYLQRLHIAEAIRRNYNIPKIMVIFSAGFDSRVDFFCDVNSARFVWMDFFNQFRSKLECLPLDQCGSSRRFKR